MDQPLQQLIDDFRNGFLTRRGFLIKAGGLGLSATALAALARETQAQGTPEAGGTPATGMPANSPAEVIWSAIAGGEWELVDLSLTAAPDYPVAWPDQPQLTVTPILWFEPITTRPAPSSPARAWPTSPSTRSPSTARPRSTSPPTSSRLQA